jgi:hypothetical protein
MTSKKRNPDGSDKPVLPLRMLSLQIRASDTHCLTWWPDAEKRCPQLCAGFNAELRCGLFGVRLTDDGRRAQACLDAEVKHLSPDARAIAEE